HVATTLAFLLLLAGVFLLGFREAISLAAAVAIPYILLNAFVLTWSLRLIYLQPVLLSHWYLDLHSFGDWTAIFVASSLVFPRLALGLSGFETGASRSCRLCLLIREIPARKARRKKNTAHQKEKSEPLENFCLPPRSS